MAVRCASCGEELLGAVNRCWRCGTHVESYHGDNDLPPVRRAPVPTAVEAEIIDEAITPAVSPKLNLTDNPSPATTESEIYDAVAADPTVSQIVSDNAPRMARRVGSPFGASVAPRRDTLEIGFDGSLRHAPRTPIYPTRTAAAGGALASLVLGVLSLAACTFTIGALFTAVIGLLVGIWGLYSNRRGQAMIGILLCCIALAVSGFNAAVLLYVLQYGFKPWETPAVY